MSSINRYTGTEWDGPRFIQHHDGSAYSHRPLKRWNAELNEWVRGLWFYDDFVNTDPYRGRVGTEIWSYSQQPSVTSSLYGITFDGTDIWFTEELSSALNSPAIHRRGVNSPTILESFAIPSSPRDMTFDGTYLWVVGSNQGSDDPIYKIDPSDGTVVSTINGPDDLLAGLTWVNGYLRVSSETDMLIHRLDPTSGTVLDTIPHPLGKGTPRGLTFDGIHLYAIDSENDTIYILDPDDGTIYSSFNAGTGVMRGLAFDGTNIWHTNNTDGTIKERSLGSVPGKRWEKNDNVVVVGGQATTLSSQGDSFTMIGTGRSSDLILETARYQTTALQGIVFRSVDIGNQWYFYISSGEPSVITSVDGAIVRSTDYPYTSIERIWVALDGAEIRLYVDDGGTPTLVDTIIDSTHEDATSHGMWTQSESSKLDYFKIWMT